MTDLRINASPGDDPISWIRHLLEESKRLGEHVRDEGKETHRKFDELREDFYNCRVNIHRDISDLGNALSTRIAELERAQVERLADLEKKQAVLNTEVKLKIAGISGIVSTVTTIIFLLLKAGLLG